MHYTVSTFTSKKQKIALKCLFKVLTINIPTRRQLMTIRNSALLGGRKIEEDI
jgi:hypothetical protein